MKVVVDMSARNAVSPAAGVFVVVVEAARDGEMVVSGQRCHSRSCVDETSPEDGVVNTVAESCAEAM